MDLHRLFDSLRILSRHGAIPVEAFGLLTDTVKLDEMCDELHRRWLSDENFAPIAARLIEHLHQLNGNKVCAICLVVLLNEFKQRDDVRARSRAMFRNSVRALVHLYFCFAGLDRYVASSLLQPMFDSLQLLLLNEPIEVDAEDVRCLVELLKQFGEQLAMLSPVQVDVLLVKLRQALCADEIQLKGATRMMILQTIELSTYGWNPVMLPPLLSSFYGYEPPLDMMSRRSSKLNYEYSNQYDEDKESEV